MVSHTSIQATPERVFHERKPDTGIVRRLVRFLSYHTKVVRLFGFLVAGHFFVGNAQAQDLEFSQFESSDQYVNPAFAGTGGAGRLIANYRNQWPDMPNSYLSYRVSYDQPVGDINSGFGLYALKDDQGDGVLSGFQLGFQYMYQVKLGPVAALNFGMQLGLIQHRLNWDKLQFFDQIDPIYGFNDGAGLPNPTNEALPPSLSTSLFDIGVGAAIVTEKLFAGLSFGHLTQPAYGFFSTGATSLPMSVSIQAGGQIRQKKRRDPFIALPTVVWHGQGGANLLQVGSACSKNLVMGGLYLKSNLTNDAGVVVMAGLRTDWMMFTYSYDVASGALSGESGGAHEVGLIFRLDDAGRATKGKYYDLVTRPGIF